MPPAPSPSPLLLHRLHRWAGLLTATFILLFSLTGIFLNHRQAFDYFQTSESKQVAVPVADLTAINAFIDQYRQAIQRPDAPEVIRIKGGKSIELLYGSHGQTTYTIDPTAGSMVVETKRPSQPLFLLNKLHKAAKTNALWTWLSDTLSLILLVATLTILMAMRFRPLDYWLLATGFALCLGGALLA